LKKYYFVFSGLWIDMNEVSNFCNGACTSSVEDESTKEVIVTRQEGNTKTGFDPNNPPYAINNRGNRMPLVC